MPNESLFLRKQELLRRIEKLPAEVSAWRTATGAQLDLQAHFSQLQAIEILTGTLVNQMRTQVTQLDPAGDPGVFSTRSFDLIKLLTRAQTTWDFFRDKLNLRYSPNHKDDLWTADTIAWDCHRPVMDRAVELGIIEESHLREPPLVYCTAQYSPATWVRGSRPNDGRKYDLGEALLPIPVVEMPWDQLGNSWEYLSLHHEVGHDIEADLRLRIELKTLLERALSQQNVPKERRTVWLNWEGEIFADLCAIELAGPAFTEALMQLLLLPFPNATSFDEDDPHPTPQLRIFLNVEYIRSMGDWTALQEHASSIEDRWKSVYGAEIVDDSLKMFVADFPFVFQSLMDTPLAALKGKTVRDLVKFGEVDDTRIRGAATFFATNMNQPAVLPLRHTVSAAKLAITSMASAGALTTQECDEVHARVTDYVRAKAPPGLRGVSSQKHEEFIASFAANTERVFPL